MEKNAPKRSSLEHEVDQAMAIDPQDLGLPNRRPFAIVKLQTVETIPVYEDARGDSIGRAIDRMIEESRKHGLVPNRLSVDLNPRTADPADVDSF